MPEDIWKAYMFHKIAGRILCLPFPVGDSQMPLKRLIDQVPGLGNSTMAMIAEYIESGTISRIHWLKYDPTRIAMKNMMNIWGIGRVTVSLYYTTLEGFDCFGYMLF
jgi:DNA polymerase/3'-5' exonuclease PolX